MKKKFEIVSLGSSCISRNILTRWGIKPKKEQGELTCPFDLAIHSIDSIIHCLETKFQDYFDDFYFEAEKRAFWKKKRIIWYKKDGSSFPHDLDCQADDFDKFKSRMQNRIDNFYKIIESDSPILFVITLFDKTDKIEQLYSVLKTICQGKIFKLCVINFAEDSIYTAFSGDVYALNLAKPCEDYHLVWYKRRFRTTQSGYCTEKCIVNFVKNLIEDEFGENICITKG